MKNFISRLFHKHSWERGPRTLLNQQDSCDVLVCKECGKVFYGEDCMGSVPEAFKREWNKAKPRTNLQYEDYNYE